MSARPTPLIPTTLAPTDQGPSQAALPKNLPLQDRLERFWGDREGQGKRALFSAALNALILLELEVLRTARVLLRTQHREQFSLQQQSSTTVEGLDPTHWHIERFPYLLIGHLRSAAQDYHRAISGGQ